MNGLNNCPFCGSEVKLGKEYSDGNMRQILCENEPCVGSGLLIAIAKRDGVYDKAIAAWNNGCKK